MSTLGIVEGFYGNFWSWEVRKAYLDYMPSNGFSFYIYAPKADSYLRKRWKEVWPDDQLKELAVFAQNCRQNNIKFGIGISPFELYLDFSKQNEELFITKLQLIKEKLAPDIVCILYDDMQGDFNELAKIQAEIVNSTIRIYKTEHLIVCPTYYSCDPILQNLFGRMPEDYLSHLGNLLPKQVDIFWTGPKICSTEYPSEHLKWVTDLLKRKPFIWDNYPVNDDQKMSAFLHLSAFQNRGEEFIKYISGQAVNPMKQPWLSMIPLATLKANRELGVKYEPLAELKNKIQLLCGVELGAEIFEDVEIFHKVGLNNMSQSVRQDLMVKYTKWSNSPFAQEIQDWLRGNFAFDPKHLE